eukprot:s514_g8.t1
MAEEPSASWGGDRPYNAEWRWDGSWRPNSWSSWWSWSPSWWSRGYGWDQEWDWRQSWNDWQGYWQKPYEDQWSWNSWRSWPPSYQEDRPSWQSEEPAPRQQDSWEAWQSQASTQPEPSDTSRDRQISSPQPAAPAEHVDEASPPQQHPDPWKDWQSFASTSREPAQASPPRHVPDAWNDWRSSVPTDGPKKEPGGPETRSQAVPAVQEQAGTEENATPCEPTLDVWREPRMPMEVPAEQPRARRPPRDITSKVFVTGLSGETGPQTLGEYCQGVGEVRHVSLFIDSDSSDLNGTAKVDFDSEETAKRAIRELSGTLLDGCTITLQSLADVPTYLWQRRDNDGCAVFVSNLATEVDRFELKAFAAEAGDVGFVRIFTDRQTGLSRGCGKVEFASLEQAQQAVQQLNGKVLSGRTVTVEPMASEGVQRRPPAVVNSHRTAFVGGLSAEMDEGGLLDLVSDIGPVTFARIFRDRQTGASKGCGKVEFETEDLVAKAVSELNGKEVQGRCITIEPFSQAHEGRPLRDAAPPVVDGRQVFLSGLSASTDSETLRKFCELSAGPVANARVFTHRDTGESRGTAKVEFDTAELAQSAIQALNGRLLDGSHLSARLMERDRPPRQPPEGSSRIFITNLPDEVSEEQVQDLLVQAGEVISVQVFKTGAGNTASRATMASSDQAQRAVSILNETFYISNRISVRMDAERPKPQTDATIFVGGLSFGTTTQGLEQHFSRVAKVVQASIFTAKDTGKPRGSGKVEFQSARDAERAVQELNGSELDGRQVHVKIMEARPPERSSPMRPPPGLSLPDSGSQLFVSGLAPTTQTELLREFCEACLGDGSVVYCNVFQDHDTGESKCTAKVELASSDLLDRAFQDLEGAQLEGGRLSLRRPGEPRQPAAPDGRTIFLGGLSWDVDSEALKSFASQVGEVTYAAVFTNKETGKSKGSGKVQFATAELASKAVEELAGQDLMGREVWACKTDLRCLVPIYVFRGIAGDGEEHFSWRWCRESVLLWNLALNLKPVLLDNNHCLNHGVIKSYDEQKGFGYIASSDFAALSGRDAYLTKEEAAAASRDPAPWPPPEPTLDPLCTEEGQPVKFQVTQNGNLEERDRSNGSQNELTIVVIFVMQVSRIGDVAQLPREGDQSGVLVIKGDPDGSEKVQSLVGKEVRFGQADCGQLILAVGDEVLFSCSVVSESPHVLDARISELRSTSRTGPILFGNFHVEFPRSGDSVCNLGGHAMQDRIVLAGLPPDLKGPELMRLFENFKAQEPLLAREDAGPRGGFASVIFQGGPTDVAQFLLRTAIAMTVDGKARAARLGFNARAPQDGFWDLTYLWELRTLSNEGGALMVRWQQVGMAVGYLVELRPFGDEAGWSPVDVSPGHHVDPHPSLPQGLLGPQCSACRVNSLREAGRQHIPARGALVPYEARVMYYAASGCRSYHSKVSTPCKPTPSASTRRDDGNLASRAWEIQR